MLPSACVGGRALPLDATLEATWGTSGDVLVRLGVRAIQFGIAAMFLGLVLKSPPDRDGQNRRADAPKPTVSKDVRLGQARKEVPLPDHDGRTAIYDITAHTVYLPSGRRLEAHSGLGGFMDNPGHVRLKMRG